MQPMISQHETQIFSVSPETVYVKPKLGNILQKMSLQQHLFGSELDVVANQHPLVNSNLLGLKITLTRLIMELQGAQEE